MPLANRPGSRGADDPACANHVHYRNDAAKLRDLQKLCQRRDGARLNVPSTVRRLAPGDLAGLRAMNRVFAEGFHAHETYAEAPPADDWAARWLANSNHIALLAESAGEPHGALAAYVLPKFEQARSEIYIYDLAVLETERRQGIATALIDHLRAIARDIGAWTIFVQADVVPEDAPARALYRKLACEEITALHFDIAP